MSIAAERTEIILRELKARGARLTKLRRMLVEIFCAAEEPLSAAETTVALVKRKLAVNKTSIYREIDFLLEQKILTKVDFLEGTKRYELRDEDRHHHHLICTGCKKVECVDVCFDFSPVVNQMRRNYHFEIHEHILEFFGRCSRCRAQA